MLRDPLHNLLTNYLKVHHILGHFHYSALDHLSVPCRGSLVSKLRRGMRMKNNAHYYYRKRNNKIFYLPSNHYNKPYLNWHRKIAAMNDMNYKINNCDYPSPFQLSKDYNNIKLIKYLIHFYMSIKMFVGVYPSRTKFKITLLGNELERFGTEMKYYATRSRHPSIYTWMTTKVVVGCSHYDSQTKQVEIIKEGKWFYCLNYAG